jgi:ABC-type nitrate/sulfonate/bicarbonate transport system permease component
MGASPSAVEETWRLPALGALGEGAPGRRVALFALSIAAGLVGWAILAAVLDKPSFMPSPLATLNGAVDLIAKGVLPESIAVSFARILAGWVLGSILGIPLGLLMGRSQTIRTLAEPYVEFFRFIPPIAFVTLAVIWFGLGETSKVVLIVYTTVFMVAINTMIGVLNVEPDKLDAARSLGARELQVFFHVTIPATVPYIVTGMKIAMGNSFMTVVSAEMIAAKSGVGWLIFDSRLYLLTSWIFVGILTLGIMGFFTDRAFRLVAGNLLRKYNVKL